jgi:hypothetical protein
MTGPETYFGYKVGTLAAMLIGVGVTVGASKGPLHVRVLAGLIGGAIAFVATPVFAPLAMRLFQLIYGWAGIPIDAVPAEGVHGLTGVFLALIGLDACQIVIDKAKKVMTKLPIPWPSKNKP